MDRLAQCGIAIDRNSQGRKPVSKIDGASTGMDIPHNNLPKAAVTGGSGNEGAESCDIGHWFERLEGMPFRNNSHHLIDESIETHHRRPWRHFKCKKAIGSFHRSLTRRTSAASSSSRFG